MNCTEFALQERYQRRLLRHSHQTRSPYGRRRLNALIVCSLALTLLAACADNTTERRFANEPLPTADEAADLHVATSVSASPVVTDPVPPLISPEALLVSRGAPQHFYVQDGARVLVFAADGTDPRELLSATEGQIRALSASPNGDRVAVLLLLDAGYELRVLSETGDLLYEFRGIGELSPPAATPVAVSAPGQDHVDWSPQGDRVLTALATGGIISIPLEGEPTLLVPVDQAPALADAQWSPAGDAVAFVSRPAGATGAGLYLARISESGTDVTALVDASTSGDASVVAMAWHPSGRSILYSRTRSSGSSALGGDLFQVVIGGQSRLVASSGRAGPVTGILAFAPSPDGRSVAFVVAIPGQNGPDFHSLWIQQLGTNNEIRLDTVSGMAVTGLWWTAAGLAWMAVPGTTIDLGIPADEFGLYLARGGKVVVVYEDLPAATPETGPAASPVPAGAATPFGGD